jgi:phosphopantothenoylcysteine decarboxylase/phosphopantothenate--cysteine ligase
MGLKNKKVLITAGPTWVPIDKVRVISNIATGRTGILLAKRLQQLGAKVTLLLGPVESCCLNKKTKLLHFKFFSNLLGTLKRELKDKHYDIVIHSAAVSDYRPRANYWQKIKSGLKHWRLDLIPTPKIIDLIKKIDKNIFLVSFKFQPQATKDLMVQQARGLISHSDSDLVVANTVYNNNYHAWIVGRIKITHGFRSRSDLSRALVNEIKNNFAESQKLIR